MLKHDNQWMRDALRLAELAAAQGEIPVGAIVVRGISVLPRDGTSPLQATIRLPMQKLWLYVRPRDL
jgi:tRNA(Arg) A34 adenosine deaminase TadA